MMMIGNIGQMGVLYKQAMLLKTCLTRGPLQLINDGSRQKKLPTFPMSHSKRNDYQN